LSPDPGSFLMVGILEGRADMLGYIVPAPFIARFRIEANSTDGVSCLLSRPTTHFLTSPFRT
jgi:hypothetical protein